MSRIAELQVMLTADTGRFSGKLQVAGRGVRKFSSAVSMAKGALVGMGVYLAGRAIVNGLRSITTESLKTLDAIGKLSDRTGISTRELMGLQHAATLTGASGAKLSQAIDVMQKRLGEATLGIGLGQRGLELLGIEVEDIINLDAASKFKAIADGVAGLTNKTQQSTAVAALFSRANLDLVNILSQGSDAIEDMIKENDALGNSFSRLDISRIEQANDAMTRVKAAITGVKNETVIGLAPAIQALSGMFTEWLTESNAGVLRLGAGLDEVKNTMHGIGKAFSFGRSGVNAFSIGVLKLMQMQTLKLGVLTGTPKIAAAQIQRQQRAITVMKNRIAARGGDESFSNRLGKHIAEAKRKAEIAQRNRKPPKGLDPASFAFDELSKKAESLFERTRTPLEKYKSELAEVNALLKAGVIDADTHGRAIVQAYTRAKDALAAMRRDGGAATESPRNILGGGGTHAQFQVEHARSLINQGRGSGVRIQRDILGVLRDIRRNTESEDSRYALAAPG